MSDLREKIAEELLELADLCDREKENFWRDSPADRILREVSSRLRALATLPPH